MNKSLPKWTKAILLGAAFVQIFAAGVFAQKTKPKTPAAKAAPAVNRPKVVQIDETGLKNALKTAGRPRLVNFWATWCVPCREEFPDLVKIDADYRGRLDVITVSLDFPEEINTTVPEFLSEMKAEMPAYLLTVADESAVISSVAKDWQGALPFTILYNEQGEIAYFKQGKFKTDVLRAEIEKIVAAKTPAPQAEAMDLPLRETLTAADGLEDARSDIAKGILRIQKYGLRPRAANDATAELKNKYGIELIDYGCLLFGTPEYYDSYNETMKAEITKRFGSEVGRRLTF